MVAVRSSPEQIRHMYMNFSQILLRSRQFTRTKKKYTESSGTAVNIDAKRYINIYLAAYTT